MPRCAFFSHAKVRNGAFGSMKQQSSGKLEVSSWELYLSFSKLERALGLPGLQPSGKKGPSISQAHRRSDPRLSSSLLRQVSPAVNQQRVFENFELVLPSAENTHSSEEQLRCFAAVGWPVMFFVGLMLLLLWCSLYEQILAWKKKSTHSNNKGKTIYVISKFKKIKL